MFFKCEESQGKLLWTNPNPDKSFSAQTVSLDLLGYDGVIIEIRTANTASTYGKWYIPNNSTYRVWGIGNSSTGTGSNANRSITVSDTGVDFAVGRNGTTNNSAYIIPINILGVKID